MASRRGGGAIRLSIRGAHLPYNLTCMRPRGTVLALGYRRFRFIDSISARYLSARLAADRWAIISVARTGRRTPIRTR